MRHLALHLAVAGALTACAVMQAHAQWGFGTTQAPPAEPAQSQAQSTPPPQGTSRGENFSAKPAPQLFASDCTGAGCHKGPQGLAKDRGQGSLANFLREHYTNSRESAASLAAYLAGVPGDARAARPEKPEAKPPRAAARPDDPTAKPGEQAKPAPAAAKLPAQPRGRQTVAAPPPPEPVPVVEPAPVAPAPPPEPPKPQWDIFD